MKMMQPETIAAINSARMFTARAPYEAPALRPWQYVEMEYARVGLTPPAYMPAFETIEDAQIWMCLDRRYNLRLRENPCAQAV